MNTVSAGCESVSPWSDNERKFMALCNGLIDEAPCHSERVLDLLATYAGPPRMVAKVAGDARLKDACPLIDFLPNESLAALALLRLGNNQDVINHCRSQNKPMLALELITGANIKETNFIPEEIDKKELFRDELEKLEGEGRLYPPGEEPGVTVTRISQNPDSWREWMAQNRQRFVTGTRYRNGLPCSPEGLIKNMESETLPGFLRQFAHEEMVIRYKTDFPFEADRPPSFQKPAIQKYEAWAKTADNSYQPGQWYFNGLLIT